MDEEWLMGETLIPKSLNANIRTERIGKSVKSTK